MHIVSSSPDLESALAVFQQRYPRYARTSLIDDLRRTDYFRFDRNEQTYLDYTGSGVYAESQIDRHFELLRSRVLGNPHSNNPSSLAATAAVERARESVLSFFNASSDDYFVVFTSNASGAIKLVGESYPFTAGDDYLLTFDNHNSVNGVREFARGRGAKVSYVPIVAPDLHLDLEETRRALRRRGGRNSLFAFPAQSNFSGVQHPLQLVAEAQESGWDVLLDVAAFVPTNRLDLSSVRPEFVTISFYKMFGYPTGVGCLLLRKSAFGKLRRPWFAGGTVQIASVQGDGHYLATDSAAFEDGTVDFLSIPAVEIGLRHLSAVGMDLIHDRVSALTGWLLEELVALTHDSGAPLAEIHGPTTMRARGGTISFNLLDPGGVSYDMARVQELANEAKISLRTGCFCNPGAGEVAFGLTGPQITRYFHRSGGMSFENLRATIRKELGREIGALRVSVGLASNFADVWKFIRFAAGFRNQTFETIGAVRGVATKSGGL
jgi:molybdenum cofactor sulfurtransferase